MKNLINALRSSKNIEEKRNILIQFIKFGLVGVSNTTISYGIEMLCFYALLVNIGLSERERIIISTAIAFVTSVGNSYFWNNRYVFTYDKQKSFSDHLLSFLKMTSCYALTGLFISPILKVWIHECGIMYWLASLLTLIITVPLNFLLNKFWAFKGNKDNER